MLVCAIGCNTVNLSRDEPPINQHGQMIEWSQRNSMGHTAGTQKMQLAETLEADRKSNKGYKSRERMMAISDRARKERARSLGWELEAQGGEEVSANQARMEEKKKRRIGKSKKR